MNKFILFSFLLFSLRLNVSAQNKIDSLSAELNKNVHDTLRIKTLSALAWELKSSDFTKAKTYCKEGIDLCVKNKIEKTQSSFYTTLGIVAEYEGKFDIALSNYFKALAISEKVQSKKGIASAYNNIGIIYKEQKNFKEAIKYYEKSLVIKIEIGDKRGEGSSLSNLGNCYKNLNEPKKALDYFFKANAIDESIGNKRGQANNYGNISSVYLSENKLKKAEEFENKALRIFIEQEDLKGQATSYSNKGAIKLSEKNWNEAIIEFEKSIKIAEEINSIYDLLPSYYGIAESYKNLGNYEKANKYNILLLAVKDSAYNQQSAQSMAEMQTKYETEQKEKEIELLNKNHEIQNIEIKREQTIIYSLFIVILLIAFLGYYIYKNYKQKQAANLLLAEQNEEITSQRDLIENQKHLVEEKNREINDSINYAHHIQKSLLPEYKIQDLLTESFVLFKPKDIVSGDFYWLEKRKETVFFAAADCTGHGVPGAMMTMIGTVLINELFNERNLSEPSKIISDLNYLLKISLKQNKINSDSRDGMDIAFCSFNNQTGLLKYAGANRPLWIIKANKELVEVKADKTSIGGLTSDTHQFAQHEIQIDKGDSIYIFSDGYADQFGGEKGKKLTTKKFKEILVNINAQSLSAQKTSLDNIIEDWQKNYEQIDDMLVIGFKFV